MAAYNQQLLGRSRCFEQKLSHNNNFTVILGTLILFLLIENSKLKSQVQIHNGVWEVSLKYEVGVLHSHLHILNSEDISERIVDYVILNVHHSALSLRNLSIHYDIEDDNNNLPNALFNLQSTLQELDIDQIRRIDLSAELNSMINIMQDPNYSNKKNNEFIIDITNEVNRINQRFLEGKTNSK